MTETYLGYPPRHIAEWIKNHMNGETKQWVDAVYTDEWVFSDGQEHTVELMEGSLGFEFSVGGSIYYTYDENGRTSTPITAGPKEELDKIVRLDIIDDGLTYQSWSAYRKYTPGHWENTETREWINGSWGENVFNAYPSMDYFDKQLHESDVYMPDCDFYVFGLSNYPFDAVPNKESWSMLIPHDNKHIWSEDWPFIVVTRTWNNTKEQN